MRLLLLYESAGAGQPLSTPPPPCPCVAPTNPPSCFTYLPWWLVLPHPPRAHLRQKLDVVVVRHMLAGTRQEGQVEQQAARHLTCGLTALTGGGVQAGRVA